MFATHKQTGFALLMLMALMSMGLLLKVSTQLSQPDRVIAIDDIVADQQALTAAKQALLGFAGSYDLTNIGQLPGYLPCPDRNGNGSANPPCKSTGLSVIGCLPWRTLGISHLKDSSGSDLLYAVSGTYKNNPKQALTNLSNGLFVIEDFYGQAKQATDQVNHQAIAVVFAPGKALAGQSRTLAPSCDTAAWYLESLKGVNNATGQKIGQTGTQAGASVLPNNTGSVFINAAPVWAANQTALIFNDQLVWITPRDYAPIYTQMSLWVSQQVGNCLNAYSAAVTDKIAAANGLAQLTWQSAFAVWEVESCDNTPALCAVGDPFYQAWLAQHVADEPLQPTPISTNIKHYPWLAPFDSSQTPLYVDNVDLRFGRIPSYLAASSASHALMPNRWEDDPTAVTACFNAAAAGLDAGEWGWWSAWREHVFLAIHADNSPVSSREFDASVSPPLTPPPPPTTPPTIPAAIGVPIELSFEHNNNLVDWTLSITGRETIDQSRQSLADKADWRNYFHCNNNQAAALYILEGQANLCDAAHISSAAGALYCQEYSEYFKSPMLSGQEACRISGDIVCGRCKTTGQVICGDEYC